MVRTRKQRLAVLLTFALAASFSILFVSTAPSGAAPSPGKIPDNAGGANFFILGGRVHIGDTATGVDQFLNSPDQPPECNDGIDDEKGAFHNHNGTPSWENVTDGKIDFGTAAGNETSGTGCINAADNLEMFDRTSMVLDTAPTCNVAAFGGNANDPPGCGSATGDACNFVSPGATANCTLAKASVVFGNGNASTGQAKIPARAINGTVSGTSISVPQANVQFGKGYQAQGSCVTTPITACVDLYVEFSIVPTANVTGTTNVDGSGLLTAVADIRVKLSMTYDSQDPLSLAPNAGDCRTSLNISNATTETDGALQGVRYDTVTHNFKVVKNNFAVSAFQPTSAGSGTYGGTAADLCYQLNKNLFANFAGTEGTPSSWTGGATNSQVELIISTDSTTNSTGSADNGVGMAANPGSFRPNAMMITQVNGGTVTASGDSRTLNVNEGDVVRVDGSSMFDPAMRTLTTNTFAETAGPAPIVTKNASGQARDLTFVAQDAPSGGTTQVFTGNVGALLGPGTQGQSDTTAITVQTANVAPVANAGPDRIVDAGNVTLNGGSTDPGDPDIENTERFYCWTQVTGGGLAAALPAGSGAGQMPACTGSPLRNAKNLALNSLPANALPYRFQLVVSDNDGGTSAADTADITARTVAANTIQGDVRVNGTLTAGINVDLFNGTGYLQSTSTNGSGHYSFAAAAGSGYYVRFGNTGTQILEFYNGAKWASTAARFSSPTSIIDANLANLGGGGTQGGTVTNAVGGAPINAAPVRIYDETGWVGSTNTNASGVYSFTFLKPKATYRLNFGKSFAGFVEEWNSNWPASSANMANLVNVAAGANPAVDAGLSPTVTGVGTVSGTVGVSACTLGTAEARLYKASGGWVTTVPVSAGAYSFTNVLPGSYRLWIWNKTGGTCNSQWYAAPVNLRGNQYEGTGSLADPFTVTAGGTNTINFTLT